MVNTVKCGYCQKVVQVSPKGYPLPHTAGASKKCIGCGMHVATHEQINAAHPNPLNPKPKKR